MLESETGMFWRRRGMAIVGVVAVALLLIWAFSGPSEPAAGSQAVPDLNTAGSTPLKFAQPTGGEPAVDQSVAGEPVVSPAQPGLPAVQPALPDAGLPGAGLPAAGQPALPGASFPAAGLPAAGYPAAGQTVPGQAVPGQVVPGQAVPGQVVPGQAVPRQTPQFPGQSPGGRPHGLATQAGTPAGIPASANQSGAVAAQPGMPGVQPAGPSTSPSARALPPLSVPASDVARPVAGQPAARAAAPSRGAAAPSAAPVKPCEDKVISVVAQVGKQSYKVGERPRFQLQVTNVGNAPCTRDLDAGLQELVVTGLGQTRVWSSNDCFPAKKPNVRTLSPGKPMIFSVGWAGRTSAPGCSGRRAAASPGEYQVVAKLGKLTSGPATFTITN